MVAHIVIGRPLPRAEEAWAQPQKLRWLLAERHGREFARVFRIGPPDADRLWAAIALGIRDVPVFSVRTVHGGAVSCRVDAVIALNGRTARVRTAWHYVCVTSAPRLVTAFPTP